MAACYAAAFSAYAILDYEYLLVLPLRTCVSALHRFDRTFTAVHNYRESGEYRLKLVVGECVCIIKECQDWYYGHVGKNKSVCGIFPRSFVHVMDASSGHSTWYVHVHVHVVVLLYDEFVQVGT